MFVDFFIKRPIFATVCALLIILGGAVSIPTLPVAQFPNLAPPTVQVSAFYNGASAQVVETSVTTPLEQQINGVEGMRYMTSTSGNDGSSGISIVFDLNRDVDLAAVDVQNRVNQALGRMPTRQLTASDVVTALQEQNVQVAAGAVGQAPAPPTQQYEISVRAVGRLADPAEFNNIVLKTAPDGTIVRLIDVGHAELGAEN